MTIEVSDLKTDQYGDLVVNKSGGVETTDSTQATKQVCIFRLKTAANDFAPNPDLGADIEGGIGFDNSQDTRDAMEARIRLAFVHDGFLGDGDFFVRIIPTSATAVVVVLFINKRRGFVLNEFSITFTYDYVTGDIQMLDEL